MELVTIDAKPCENFEKQIAYFFNVKDQKPVSDAFIDALNLLEEAGYGELPPPVEAKVLHHIGEAYRSIAMQQNWDFDIPAAAKLELDIILGLAQGMSIEQAHDLSTKLYILIFQTDSLEIRKAVMLRTFLYSYKNMIQQIERDISSTDQLIMLDLARTSEKYLNAAPKKCARPSRFVE